MLKQRLIATASRLGIEFVDPQRIINELLLSYSPQELYAWLDSEQAVQWIKETYGFQPILETESDSGISCHLP